MSEPDDLLLVHTTCADVGQARTLSEALVDRRLAACVTVGAAVGSTYPWGGAIQHDEEIPLTLKTTRAALPALKAALAELHPYDVPEVLAVPVVDASDDYAAWVRRWLDGSEA
ncbi:divalent-cation tolerance protein CutA [Halomonas denitrificans]|nr:divalent-cation tolerance protein CutA [Halomonas denitrificans]